ncbi:hypothetical protein AWN76_007185 [Rhodothermaceae bacterium RA]|nr:hypothetical protein AWN76_007185 [Rhodothermaceae bacterium RA]
MASHVACSFLLIGSLLALHPPLLPAQDADWISYQGRLTAASGAPLPDSVVTLTFRLYDQAEAGTPIWSETHPEVTLQGGVFTVSLGRWEPLTGVPFGTPLWLGLAVGDATAPEFAPRTPLGAVPYALSVRGLRIRAAEDGPSLLGGYAGNVVTDGVAGATIAGGGAPDLVQRITDGYGTVGGGLGNQAGDGEGSLQNAAYATVGGGQFNQAAAAAATVGGGSSNQARSAGGTIGGGAFNRVLGPYATVGGGGGFFTEQGNRATSDWSTVGGGRANAATAAEATIAGGSANTARGPAATIGGGSSNQAAGTRSTVGGGQDNTASGTAATVAGGQRNTATATAATVSGGEANRASGIGSSVPGGTGNQARGRHSFAAGFHARAAHDGAFVWADDAADSLVSAGPRSFQVRASGGIWLYTAPDAATGVVLPAGSGAWSTLSDRHHKTDFAPVDPRSILDRVATLPLQTWRYTTEADGLRHLGPTAQDFHAAFGLGADERHIATVDADGVALAAIQGLWHLVQAQAERLDSLEALVRAQQRQLDALEASRR